MHSISYVTFIQTYCSSLHDDLIQTSLCLFSLHMWRSSMAGPRLKRSMKLWNTTYEFRCNTKYVACLLTSKLPSRAGRCSFFQTYMAYTQLLLVETWPFLVGQTKRVFQCHCETMLRIRELSHSPPPPLRLQLHVNVMREFFKIRAILCFLAGLCSAPHYFSLIYNIRSIQCRICVQLLKI